MTPSRTVKADTALEDADAIDAIRTFIGVQARSWVRRQQNEMIPRVLHLMDAARSRGDAVDVPALIRQVHLERQVPELAAGE
jgi:hypothetical protein